MTWAKSTHGRGGPPARWHRVQPCEYHDQILWPACRPQALRRERAEVRETPPPVADRCRACEEAAR